MNKNIPIYPLKKKMSSRKIHFTWLLHEEIMLIKIREREDVEKMKKEKRRVDPKNVDPLFTGLPRE